MTTVFSKRVDITDAKQDLHYLRRLGSYHNWPESAARDLTPARLAAAGFYYTTFKDKVKCSYCDIEHGQWCDGDRPLEVHRRLSPHCPFVLRQAEDLDVDADEIALDGEGEDQDEDQTYNEVVDLAQCATTVRQNKAKNRAAVNQSLSALKQENEQIRAQLKCKSCKKEKIQSLFLPCRHLVSCEACADKVDYCFYCATKIMGTVKTYII